MSDVRNSNQGLKKTYSPAPSEARRLAAARRGNSRKFGELAEPYRRELQVHCYRILGSVHDAEDMVQETMLRAWNRLDTYQERATFRAWLYKIATNVCLDLLDKRRRRAKRLLPSNIFSPADPHKPIEPPMTEILWLEPLPDEWLSDSTAVNPETRYSTHESISLAFLIALQILPPRQRAVLILKDVLDWSASEIAELLDTTTSSVNSALHRARVTLAKNYQRREAQSATAGRVVDEHTQKLLEKYIRAWQTADVNGLVALLRKDAALSMPPSPSWYAGRESIAKFAANTVFADDGMFPGVASGRWKLLPIQANGQPGAGVYQRMEHGVYHPFGVHVLTCDQSKIAQISCFIDSSLPTLFGLPEILGTE